MFCVTLFAHILLIIFLGSKLANKVDWTAPTSIVSQNSSHLLPSNSPENSNSPWKNLSLFELTPLPTSYAQTLQKPPESEINLPDARALLRAEDALHNQASRTEAPSTAASLEEITPTEPPSLPPSSTESTPAIATETESTLETTPASVTETEAPLISDEDILAQIGLIEPQTPPSPTSPTEQIPAPVIPNPIEVESPELAPVIPSPVIPTPIEPTSPNTSPSPLSWYEEQVDRTLQQHWVPPQNQVNSANTTVVISLEIYRNGSFQGSLSQPSGNPRLDQSFLEMLRNISQLPQLPAEYPHNSYVLHITYEFN